MHAGRGRNPGGHGASQGRGGGRAGCAVGASSARATTQAPASARPQATRPEGIRRSSAALRPDAPRPMPVTAKAAAAAGPSATRPKLSAAYGHGPVDRALGASTASAGAPPRKVVQALSTSAVPAASSAIPSAVHTAPSAASAKAASARAASKSDGASRSANGGAEANRARSAAVNRAGSAEKHPQSTGSAQTAQVRVNGTNIQPVAAAPSTAGAAQLKLHMPAVRQVDGRLTPRSNLLVMKSAARKLQSAFRRKRWMALIAAIFHTDEFFDQHGFRPLVEYARTLP